MRDEAEGNGGAGDESAAGGESDPGAERQEGARGPFGEGVRQGLGMLSAVKEALEETIQEARERGDLSAERAREAMRNAMSRAREAAGDARERFDFATQDDLDDLRDRVEELTVRLTNMERRQAQSPDTGPTRPAEGEGGDPE